MLADVNGFQFINNSSVAITLNDYTYPFTQQLDITLDDPSLDKAGFQYFDGAHYQRSRLNGMTITVEGDIFADTPELYFTARQTLINCLRNFTSATVFPYRNGANTNFQDGIVKINFLGSTEVWKTDSVHVVAFTAPIRAENGPCRTPYMITFWSNFPYFYGDTTGDVYFYS